MIAASPWAHLVPGSYAVGHKLLFIAGLLLVVLDETDARGLDGHGVDGLMLVLLASASLVVRPAEEAATLTPAAFLAHALRTAALGAGFGLATPAPALSVGALAGLGLVIQVLVGAGLFILRSRPTGDARVVLWAAVHGGFLLAPTWLLLRGVGELHLAMLASGTVMLAGFLGVLAWSPRAA